MRVSTSARGKSEDDANWERVKEKGKRKKRTKVSTFFFLERKTLSHNRILRHNGRDLFGTEDDHFDILRNVDAESLERFADED